MFTSATLYVSQHMRTVMNGHDVARQNNHNKRLYTSLGIVDCKFAQTSMSMKPFMKCLNFKSHRLFMVAPFIVYSMVRRLSVVGRVGEGGGVRG